MHYKDLTPEQRSGPTAELLEYIAQYGTTKGSLSALSTGDITSCLHKLLGAGYITPMGPQKYEVTEKGWDYLGAGPGVEYYDQVPVEPPTPEEVSRLAQLKHYLFGRGPRPSQTPLSPEEEEHNLQDLLRLISGGPRAGLTGPEEREFQYLADRLKDARRGYIFRKRGEQT